ncbi:nitroreductase family deazaflavin-dependent oxidoreductase [Actinomadura sp. ATCC 31491]|uniref:Nitroreductase family deazaflavin-dependent oxidoreductase n=1 Tax=Actinomadura luzonensis TaxID=2805427 RepID=A0ABT0FYD4_9ACTN|nr:nitroreductase/quinone reductase family protein [Actinomadura luzonensis]MCK2217327.1 nitroreductase family deazaflavin-dependent oxidoreductase [Actinomadura luzonensis]
MERPSLTRPPGRHAPRRLDRLQNLLNPFVVRLLRSPLHDLVSGSVALLEVTGRRSGRLLAVPVSYRRERDVLRVLTRRSRQWWRNVRGGAPLRALVGGVTYEAVADAGPADPEAGGELVAVTVHLEARAPAAGPGPRGLWRRWFAAVTLGEIAGFAVPAVTGALAAGVPWGLLGIGPLLQGATIVAAGLAEGVVLGLAQAYALRSALPGAGTREWVRATAGGAGIAWTVGALPFVLGERLWRWHPAVLVLLGVVLLAGMGVLQWRVLRRHVPRAWRWVPATMAAWLVALGAFMLVATPLWQEGQPGWLVAAVGVLAGAVMAATVAALTGLALVRLLRPVMVLRPPT